MYTLEFVIVILVRRFWLIEPMVLFMMSVRPICDMQSVTDVLSAIVRAVDLFRRTFYTSVSDLFGYAYTIGRQILSSCSIIVFTLKVKKTNHTRKVENQEQKVKVQHGRKWSRNFYTLWCRLQQWTIYCKFCSSLRRRRSSMHFKPFILHA